MNLELLKKNFEMHGFQTSFFETGQEAVAYLKKKITGCSVGIGGSMTIKDMGLAEALMPNNTVYWHWLSNESDVRKKAQMADVYLCSANGVAETGELVNIDGTGNRVAATVFGPEKVYFLVGANKIEPDLSRAIERARNVASTKNARRFKKDTPCVKAGGEHCYDCCSPERICRALLILERPCNGMEVEVIFIDEEFGY